MKKLGVIGGGAWGTALAQVAAAGGTETLVWAIEEDVVAAINRIHENPVYLKGQKLHPAIRATSNFSDLSGCEAWLVVTPAQHMRAVLSRAPCPDMPLILCSRIKACASPSVASGAMVIGLTTIPLSKRLTRRTASHCSSIVRLR